jgi:NAD(P)-dependent dehydrogenase (short-subunit alcohol dehydrogenase family)
VIINNASNAGLTARAHDPVYAASKAGLVMLTRSMALAHAQDRIRVNAICPGPVGDTVLMQDYIATADDPAARAESVIRAAPMAAAWGRMITPEEIAAAVLFLCSDAAVMITGAVLAIDGGKSAGIL